MNLKMLSPWNWFKKEEESHGMPVPVNVARRYDYPIERMHKEMDRLFDSFFRGFPFPSVELPEFSGSSNLILKPRVDIAEDDKAYSVTVEAPGVEKGDIRLTVDDDTLTIKGEKRQQSEQEEKGYHRVERSFGTFQRVISLPADVDADRVSARFKDGLLKITIPKNPLESSNVRQIEID